MAKALLVGIFLLIGLFPTQAPARPIVYGTPDPSLGTQGWDVWQINPDGTGNLLLFHFDPSSADIVLSLRHPVWSRDGSLLAAAGTIPANSNLPNFPQGGLGVVVFDPVTGSKTPVTPLGTAFDEQVYLAFSGDKQRLAYTDGNLLETEFYVTTLDGRRVLVGGETTNESGGPLYNFGIDWAPTANQLVIPLTFPCGSVIRCVVTPPASPGPYPATGLFLVPPELGGLSNAIQLTVPQLFQVSCFFGLLPCLVTTQDVFPVFSPNGRLVAFTRWYTDVGGTFYGSQIALVDITSADRTPQAIYTTQQRVCGLSWSGDGTQLAFALGQDIGSLVAVCGNRGLWIVDAAPNSTPQQIPVPAPPLGTTESPSWNWGFNPVPSLSPSPFSPSGALAGGTAVTLTINGNNFLPSSTVSWNGQPRTPTFVSPTQLQLAVSATDIASAGTIPVTVVNPPPGGGTAAANFTIFPSFVLSVVRGGNGSGAVTSAPGGIACGATCSARFASGSQVVLTAAADAGSAFTGWSGCDSVSTNRCSITLTSTKTVTATFQLLTFRLTVNKAGTGNGTVTGTVVSGTGSGNVTGTVSPPGTISCGGVCSEVLNSGTGPTDCRCGSRLDVYRLERQ